MQTHREKVRDFLRLWVNTKNSPHFAVLIEGAWGCGKTFFIKNLIKEKNFTKRNCLYLSLFGLEDIEAFRASLFEVSASQLSKFFKGGSIFLIYSLNDSGWRNLPKIFENVLRAFQTWSTRLDNSVLVLDDLERCSIPMEVLLGVINQMVEHGNTRVILLANSEKIKGDAFKAFKEKLVGHSVQLESDPKVAIDTFIGDIDCAEVRDILNKHTELICELYKQSTYHNLRLLRHYIWHLADIVAQMNAEFIDNTRLMSALIKRFFIFFVEYKLDLSDLSARLQPVDLLPKFSNGTTDFQNLSEKDSGDKEPPSPTKAIFEKYNYDIDCSHPIITYEQWVSILTSGVVDKSWLNRDLAKADEFKSHESWPSWRRLFWIQSLDLHDESEEAFQRDIEDINANLKSGAYQDMRTFLHVVGVKLMLVKEGLIDDSLGDVVAEVKTYIDDHFIPGLDYDNYKRIKVRENLEHSNGAFYLTHDTVEFKAISTHLTDRAEAWFRTWIAGPAAEEMCNLILTDHKQFLNDLIYRRSPEKSRFSHVPVLKYINPDHFAAKWLQLPRIDEKYLDSLAEDRLENPIINQTEQKWWRRVQNELQKVAETHHTFRRYQIQKLSDGIDKVLSDKPKPTPANPAELPNTPQA